MMHERESCQQQDHPGFSFTCHIWSWNRELTKRKVTRVRIRQHRQWLSELDSTIDKKLGEQLQPSQQGESQHSKSQLDWRKTWTVTSADPWEVREQAGMSQASCLTQEKLGMSCCDRVNDYSRSRRFYEGIRRNGRGQFNDRKKTIHSKKYNGLRVSIRTYKNLPGVDENFTHSALITILRC